MKTMFVSQIILFEETLEFQNVISICYGWQQATHMSSKVHVFHTWVVTQTIANTFFLVVKPYVLNQIEGFQLLSDELIYAFTLCIMKVNVGIIQAFFQPLICGNFDSKLQEFKLKMMTQVINIFTFVFVYNPTKAHHMLVIIFDPYFKNMKIIWDFMNDQLAVQIVTK